MCPPHGSFSPVALSGKSITVAPAKKNQLLDFEGFRMSYQETV
jgi:hypothetical protein